MKRGKGSEPLPKNRILFQGDCRNGAAVDGLLTIAGVASIGVDDPGLIISKLKHLGAEFTAESTSDTQIQINLRRSHNHCSLLDVFDQQKQCISYT